MFFNLNAEMGRAKLTIKKLSEIMLIADMYDNRQLQVDKNVMNKTAETILGMYCINFL